MEVSMKEPGLETKPTEKAIIASQMGRNTKESGLIIANTVEVRSEHLKVLLIEGSFARIERKVEGSQTFPMARDTTVNFEMTRFMDWEFFCSQPAKNIKDDGKMEK